MGHVVRAGTLEPWKKQIQIKYAINFKQANRINNK